MRTAGKRSQNQRTRKRRVRAMLGNESGASLVAAILFFVLCGVGASVILAAASASAGKMKKVPEADQKRFAVESAAGFLRDELKDSRNTIKITEKKEKDSREETPDYEEPVYTYSNGTALDDTKNILDSCVEQIYYSFSEEDDPNTEPCESAQKEFLLSVQKQSGTDTLHYDQLETKVDFVIDSDYKITAVISDTQTDDAHQEDRCERVLTVPSKVQVDEDVDVKEYEETDENGDVTDEWTVTTTTRTTTIYWERGTIGRTHPEKDGG